MSKVTPSIYSRKHTEFSHLQTTGLLCLLYFKSFDTQPSPVSYAFLVPKDNNKQNVLNCDFSVLIQFLFPNEDSKTTKENKKIFMKLLYMTPSCMYFTGVFFARFRNDNPS